MEIDFLIVGIAGKIRSGKDSLAEIFINNGFFGVSVGDIVRQKSKELNSADPNPISTENMTKTANYLRSKFGSDFLFREAISRYKNAIKSKNYKGLVIYSVRAPIEADNILKYGGELIWIDSKDEVRYERAMSNLRKGDSRVSFEDFKIAESQQFLPNSKFDKDTQMNLDYVKSKATIRLTNNQNDISQFRDKALKIIKSF